MKSIAVRIQLSVPCLLFIISLVVPVAAQESESEVTPYQQHEDYEQQVRRDEWIEQMHRTAPGVNWRVIEQENREAMASMLSAKGKNRSSILSSAVDTIAGILQGRWRERGSANQAGRIVCADIDVDREVIYAASASGNIWRGTVEGRDWKSLNDGMRFNGVTMLRQVQTGGKRRLLALHNSPAMLHYSEDDGETWKVADGLDTIARWGSFRRGIVVGSGDTIYALGQEWDYKEWVSVTTIYQSTDAGASFHNLYRFPGSPNRYDIWASADGSTVMFLRSDSLFQIIQSGAKVFRSMVNGGSGVNMSNIQQFYLTGAGSGASTVIYAILVDASDAHCVASTDGGLTWGYRGKTTKPYSPNSVIGSQTDPNSLFVGAVECFRSYDGGRNWVKHADWWDYYNDPEEKLHADIFGIQTFTINGGEFMLISTDGGLYISYDALNSVTNLSLSGLNVSQYYSTYTRRSDGKSVYAGSQDQGLQYASIDGGGVLSFDQVISGDYGHLVSGDGGRSIWCNYPGFSMFREAGRTSMPRWDFTGQGQLWLPPIVADPEDPRAAFVTNTGEDGGSYLWHLKVTDSNIKATQLPFDFSIQQRGRNISAMAISPVNHDDRYVLTTDGFFFHTSNAGDTWSRTDTSFLGPEGHYFYGANLLPSPKSAGRIYIAGSGYSNPGVFVSNDYGVTFDSITTGLPGTLIYDMDIDPEERFLFAATEAGPYLYDVERKTWYSMATVTSPDQVYWSVEYVNAINTVRFGTHGRGIWDFVIENVASGVMTTQKEEDRDLALAVAPNPMRSIMTLAVTMPISGRAHVRIYDIEGRVVNELYDGELHAGINQLAWDGRSSGGYELPSGRYLVVVNTLGNLRYSTVDIVR